MEVKQSFSIVRLLIPLTCLLCIDLSTNRGDIEGCYGCGISHMSFMHIYCIALV